MNKSAQKSIQPGDKFGRWTVLAVLPNYHCYCECECGTLKEIWTNSLLNALSRSCGCLRREVAQESHTTHGQSFGPFQAEYHIYRQAKGRCTNPKNPAWKNYGGRGIEFRFTSFSKFLECLGPRPDPNYTLDRIDNNGHYEPGNVRWATYKQQSANRRPDAAAASIRRAVEASARKRFQDLTGRQFGRLIVLKFAEMNRHSGSLWLCQCTCGQTRVASKVNLLKGITQSCGCIKRHDLTGKTFGRLTVLGRSAKKNEHGSVSWIVRCECGNVRTVYAASLRTGRTQSCGCLHREIVQRRRKNT